MSAQPTKTLLLKESPSASNISTQSIPAPPPAYTYHPPATEMDFKIEQDSLDSHDELSSIIITISSSVTVLGDDNLIAIDSSQSASNIAQSIARTLKDFSMSGAGIPMIDEEGRPRPIKVDIDAAIRVNGTKNTIGEGAMICDLQASFISKRKRQENDDTEESEEEIDNERVQSEGSLKKQRAA